MSLDYDRVCRLCLSSRGELLSIFGDSSPDDTEPSFLPSKIEECVSVQISENDELPTNVCRKCIDNVNNWHIFRRVCQKTQNKLQNLMKKDGSQLEDVNIKSEPLSEEYDDGVVIDGSYPDQEQNTTSSNKLQPEGPPILASLGLTPRSDKKYVDPRMDWQRVHAILDLVQEDEVIDSLKSVEETDTLQQSDHDSDTDAELLSDIESQYIDCKNGYRSKSNSVLLKGPKISKETILFKINKMNSKQKQKTYQTPKHCPKPHHAWQYLFTDDVLDLIVESTNESIAKNKGKSKLTNTTEIKAFIGILYFHGINRPVYTHRKNMWDDKFGAPVVKGTMDYNRFKFLMENLCFDKEEDYNLLQFDTMHRIRKIFEIVALNCRSAYNVDKTLVLDEVIVPVYGPCPFRYHIDKKQLKKGIKLAMVVDPSTFYINNIDVITDPYFGPEEVAKKVLKHLAGTGKTVLMDSWYTSSTLMETLLREYDLYSVCALNPIDDVIPPVFLSQLRKSQTFMTGFLDEDITLTSYVTLLSKAVNVLNNNPKFYKKGHVEYTTPVSLYKKHQSAVEVVDVLMHYYTTMQVTNDWTLSLFFTLLNIVCVNAQVIWCAQNTKETSKRIDFIRELAYGLMKNEFKVMTKQKKPAESKPTIPEKLELTSGLLRFTDAECRKRCKVCRVFFKKCRKTRSICIKCGNPMCREHTSSICIQCCD